MLDWLAARSDALNPLLSAAMLVVWIVYLHLFLVTLLRQRRSELLIVLKGGNGTGAHCVIGNLGLQPIYVCDLAICRDGGLVMVTEPDDAGGEPWDLARQGPLGSGEALDCGPIADLLNRAGRRGGEGWGSEGEIEIVALAVMAASASVVAARRGFRLSGDGRLVPTDYHTCQIRGPLARRRLLRRVTGAPGSAAQGG